MFNHEPADYNCIFCKLISGVESEHNKLSDIVFENDLAIAVVAPRWWPNNKGSLLVIPKRHYENIYEIDDSHLAAIGIVSKKLAIAIRQTYQGCKGVSTRQHNEPIGGQDVWHFHAHIFPRYENDNLYFMDPLDGYTSAKDRLPYAVKIREHLLSSI
jgi:histidine triad (HIT) family protein